jgi:hypothetical protein
MFLMRGNTRFGFPRPFVALRNLLDASGIKVLNLQFRSGFNCSIRDFPSILNPYG